MNVLLVDDDPEIRMITTFLLEQGGHHVVEAADDAEARAALRQSFPDVVLMDVMLGDVDGVELTAQLCALDTPAPLRVIFLTGATRSEQLARMNATPAIGILRKPFDPGTFLQSFHQIIGE